MSTLNSKLDAALVIRKVYDASTEAIKIKAVSGSLVPDQYDSISLTYITSGFGTGEIGTVTYFLSSNQVALLTLAYDASNRLITVTRT